MQPFLPPLPTSFGTRVNHKTIKLLGGPQDGAILEVLPSAYSYSYTSVEGKDAVVEYVYRELDSKTAKGESIFTCFTDISRWPHAS